MIIETVHAKGHTAYGPAHDRSRFVFQFLKCAKKNGCKNVRVAKIAKTNSHEKSWFTVLAIEVENQGMNKVNLFKF